MWMRVRGMTHRGCGQQVPATFNQAGAPGSKKDFPPEDAEQGSPWGNAFHDCCHLKSRRSEQVPAKWRVCNSGNSREECCPRTPVERPFPNCFGR